MAPIQRVCRLLSGFIALLLVAVPVAAQQVVPYTLADESELTIDGTSTRSDWTVFAEDIEGNFMLAVTDEAVRIESAEFAVRASSVVSRRATIMDRLISDALKADAHPVIRYNLTGAEPGTGSQTLRTQGTLTIAGETRDVEFDVNAEPLGDGRIRFTGSHPVKMSEYDMQAPVAMFGALRTGDDVVVHFNIIVGPSS